MDDMMWHSPNPDTSPVCWKAFYFKLVAKNKNGRIIMRFLKGYSGPTIRQIKEDTRSWLRNAWLIYRGAEQPLVCVTFSLSLCFSCASQCLSFSYFMKPTFSYQSISMTHTNWTTEEGREAGVFGSSVLCVWPWALLLKTNYFHHVTEHH